MFLEEQKLIGGLFSHFCMKFAKVFSQLPGVFLKSI